MPAASPAPSSPSAIPSLDASAAEVTAESLPAPIQALPFSSAQKLMLGRLWLGPASYGALFVLGFGVAFSIGVAVAWPKYDPAALLAAGRIADVITVVDATSGAPADWQRLKGHALQLRGDADGMLKAYQLAVAGNAVDDQALEHTLAALGLEKSASLAVKTLEDWPGIDDTLLKISGDGVWLRRHKATELLRMRPSATPAMRLQAEVRNAVADVRANGCEVKLAGIKALLEFGDNDKALAYLKAAQAWDTVSAINDTDLAANLCLPRDLVQRTVKSLAKSQLK